MQILIKSFNRAYYLDRCLSSIVQFAKGYQNVIIMDDGTPKAYLDAIEKKYPFVEFRFSEQYQEKSEACSKGLSPNSKEIPSALWVKTAHESEQYFLLLEEDMWLTATVNLDAFQNLCTENNVGMLKLFWLNNPNLIQAKSLKPIDDMEIFELTSSQKNWKAYYLKYYRFHRLKWLKKLFGLYNLKDQLSYYSVYAVAGMIFNKNYYTNVWKDKQTKVYENQQILNGLKALKHYNYQFAKSKNALINTGFISSSTNDDDIKKYFFDQFQWNLFLNNLWLNNQIDVLQNFPDDFSENYMLELLENSSFEAKEWQLWHHQFKSYYQSIGCNI